MQGFDPFPVGPTCGRQTVDPISQQFILLVDVFALSVVEAERYGIVDI